MMIPLLLALVAIEPGDGHSPGDLLLCRSESVGEATPVAPAEGLKFGWSLGLEGRSLLVGADRAEVDGLPDAGAVFEYRRTASGEWTERAVIRAGAPAAGAFFGHALARDRETLIVGALWDPSLGPFAGAAYVFERSRGGWVQVQKLVPSDGESGWWFGISVAVDGDWAVIGARKADAGAAQSGAAYVFRRKDGVWTEHSKLAAEDASFDADFGHAVAICNGMIAVGAHGTAGARGQAYLFERDASGWRQSAELAPPLLQADDWFGISLDVEPDAIAVGARRFDAEGVGASGAVFVWDRAGRKWKEPQLVVPDLPEAGMEFGNRVDLRRGVLAVGAWLEDSDGVDTGAAYVFTRDRRRAGLWTQQQRLVPCSASPEAFFGHGLYLADGALAVGAFLDDFLAPDSGRVWVVEPD